MLGSAPTRDRGFELENTETWMLAVLSASQVTSFVFWIIAENPWRGIYLQPGVDIRSPLLINWHLHPNPPHAIQVDVRKTEGWFLVRNVVALRQDCSPRIHDLSDTDISENEDNSGATTTKLTALPKGVDSSSRANIP